VANEPVYTLKQAKVIGLRELCGRRGHDFQHMRAENWGGEVVINYYECGICDVVVSLSYLDLT
jgi:hypothetical protein